MQSVCKKRAAASSRAMRDLPSSPQVSAERTLRSSYNSKSPGPLLQARVLGRRHRLLWSAAPELTTAWPAEAWVARRGSRSLRHPRSAHLGASYTWGTCPCPPAKLAVPPARRALPARSRESDRDRCLMYQSASVVCRYSAAAASNRAAYSGGRKGSLRRACSSDLAAAWAASRRAGASGSV